MDMFEFTQNPTVFFSVIFILGLCVGSFLNVVIYRTPKIMEYEYLQDVHTIGQQYNMDVSQLPKLQAFTLSKPASHCPSCGHAIKWYNNIPVLSWLFQKGRCMFCSEPISWRYPIVEISTALLSLLAALQFGATMQCVGALILLWYLVALTGIDFDTQLLPDRLTLPLAGIGLLFNSHDIFVSPVQAIYGYVIGFLCLWVVYIVFKLLTGKEGMGYGDFKLLAALGAWLGPNMLPLIVLLSSLLGSIVGIAYLKIRKQNLPFAFGPYIALAGIVALLWGKPIISAYLGMYTH